jgi:hypothetical protein
VEINMSNDNTTDPTEMFREWVTQWERAVDSFSNQLMGTDDFSRAVNSVQNTQLQLQKVFAEMMARHLANLNMPSKQDVMELAESMQLLDTRMARIETRLENLSGTIESAKSGKPSSPPRTKRPPRTKKAPAKK